MGFLDSYSAQIKSILRIITGLLFFSVGLAKIAHFPDVPGFDKVMAFDGIEGWSGVIELVGGALVCIGFFSRYAAFICSGEMAVAYFMAHWAIVTPAPHSFYPVINGGSAAILYCFVFLYFAATGPGPWAINQK
jgi:putative oxidoreductase